MKFYLSSYKIGDEPEKLWEMTRNKTIGFIPNSLDHAESTAREQSNDRNMKDLYDLDIDVEMLDLKEYFGKQEFLEEKIRELDGVWVRGGNIFVLRQAMRLSGFDKIIKKYNNKDFFYGGFSAGVCILAQNLKPLKEIDHPDITPYEESTRITWEGLGMLDYMVLPHYESNHPESHLIGKGIEYCQKHSIPYKPLRDGEVIIIE